MKIQNENNKIIIDYSNEEGKLIEDNYLLFRLNSNCICLIGKEELKKIDREGVKGVLIDGLMEYRLVIDNGEVVGKAIPF